MRRAAAYGFTLPVALASLLLPAVAPTAAVNRAESGASTAVTTVQASGAVRSTARAALPPGAPRTGIAASAWALPVDVTFFGVHDDESLRVKPTQWGTGRLHAAWCDVQPTAASDAGAVAADLLERPFRVSARNNVRRLNVSLGHPAAWVFADHPRATATADVAVWYCQHSRANVSVPTARSLTAGPVHDAYAAYVGAVIAAAGEYLATDPGNRLVLQAWNEPNLGNGGQVRRTIPGAARTWKQAAASLQQQERIIRAVAEALIPGRYELSSPALYGKSNALLTAYLARQAKDRTVDSVSLNFYSHRVAVTGAMARWTKKAATAIQLVRRHRGLRALPVWITETNHNLVNYQPSNRANMQGLWASAATQRHLVEVTTAEAMRLGYAGLEWYQGTLQQVGVNTRAGSVGAQAAQEFLTEVAGRTLLACTTRRSVVTCTLSGRDAVDPSIQLIWSAKGFDGVTFVHPQPAVPVPVA